MDENGRITLLIICLIIVGVLLLEFGNEYPKVQECETTKTQLAYTECGVRAQERDFTSFYIEDDNGNQTCWGEFHHPLTGQLLRVELNNSNRYPTKDAIYHFTTGE